MANPQVENGHTQIANELLEHLGRAYLSPDQWRVFVIIIRKTYGFKKKSDYIANAQLVEATGLHKAAVSRALKNLAAGGFIVRSHRNIGVQKDWEQWKVNRTVNRVNRTVNSVAKVNSTVNNGKLTEQLTELTEQLTKVNSTLVTQKKKETIQKKDIIPLKKNYGEFSNVLLTDEEYGNLVERFGDQATHLIENLSAYLASRNKKYKSHYATILNWQRRDGDHAKVGSSRALPKAYTPTPDYPDL